MRLIIANPDKTPLNVPRSQVRVRRLRLIWAGVVLGIVAYQWSAWPDAGILFGPFWLVRGQGFGIVTGLAAVCLLSLLFAYPARPGRLTAIVSAAGILLWCAVGVVGSLTVTVPAVVPAATAYTDGFEVVVATLTADGTLESARSIPLAEVEQAADNEGAMLLLPADEAAVAAELESSIDKSGDVSVRVTVTRLSADRQQVRTSFHYSMRTYYYEYEVNGPRVRPIESGHRDRASSSASRYAPAGG